MKCFVISPKYYTFAACECFARCKYTKNIAHNANFKQKFNKMGFSEYMKSLPYPRTKIRSSKGVCLPSSAHSCTAISTPPVVMTLCAVPSEVKYARVPAASVAMQITSTDRIKSFRFIVLAPLKLILPYLPDGRQNRLS